MVKFARKLLALMLAVCMLLSSVAIASATGTETGTGSSGGSQIQDNKVSDLTNLPDPLEGVEVTPPYISAQGESILMTKENELLLYSSNRTENENGAADDAYHIFEEMTSATSYASVKTTSGHTPALDLSLVTAVALDATDNGSDDHVAYLGVAGKNTLRVVLYNARTNTMAATLDIGTVGDWIKDVDQWAYKTFFSITAGDYDNDGIDEIACTDANMGVQMIEIGTGSGSALTLTEVRNYNWSAFVPASVAGKMTVTTTADVERRALISLATGNLDGTGAEELAVAVSTNDPDDSDYLPTVPAACTTQVAAVLTPLSPSATIRTTSIRTTSKDIKDEELQANVIHTVLYAGQITAGDVNGDRKDEIVVAGYPGKITVDGEKKLSGQYVLKGDSQDGDGDIQYKVALCYATLDGDSNNPSLGHSAITLDAMTAFIDEGFFAGNDLLVPLSVDAAKLHGQYGKESVFAGGKVYQFEGEAALSLYTHEFFETRSSSIYTDAYVEHVTSGVFGGTDPLKANDTNISNKEMINEQFVFTVVEKDSSQNDYNYKVGFVSMSTDKDGNAVFYDNTETMGYLFEDLDGGVEAKYGTAMVPVAVDIDDDGLRVKYLDSYGHYEDPTVVAVLQAAPYFDELGDWNDFSGATTYTETVSRSLIDLQGHSHSIHTGGKGKAGNDLVGELEVKIGYALDMDYQHEMAYTDEYSTTFEAGPYDTVVVQRTPYVCYEYQRVDINGDPLTGDNEGSVVFMEAMQPIYFQLSVDEYNQFVDEYNAMADKHDAEGETIEGSDNYRLVKITEDILPVNATGNPENYFSTLYGGQYVSQGTTALGHNGGSTSSQFSKEYSYTYTALFAHGMHFEIEGVYMFWPGAGGLGAFAETSFQDTAGWGNAEVNAEASGGTVANIYDQNYSASEQQTLKQYGFNWRCALWKKSLMTKADGITPFRDANGKEFMVPVVGYVVTDVTSPMTAPTGVDAYLSGRGNQVTVEWNRSADAGGTLQGYSIYRYCDNQDPVLVNTTRLAPEVTSFVDSTKLRPGKIYTYYVTAFYSTGTASYKTMNSKSSAVVWGIPLFWLNEEEGGGDDSPSGG